MENDRVCTFKFKDQSRSSLSLQRHGAQWPFSAKTKAVSVFRLYHVYNLDVLPCCTFPYSSLSEIKRNKAKTLDAFSHLAWLLSSYTEHTPTLKLSDAIAAAFKYDCRFCLCSVCLCGCSHSSSSSSSFFPPLSYFSSLDPRQTEGAPLCRGMSPPPP